ncbi:hypothetical protein OHA72_09890 [Dactylosporangium sp. NBC_01737]|uniref:hypothetical protein n=1 Tax=Dactylosporangium sp. NBC_01737 TaxID=2975959 RepID=UPI002E143EBF|nr:hypothetical protein OHA72_09890 [Dactylosporangium sp. NBC_01737]
MELILPQCSYASVQVKRISHPGRDWRPAGTSGALPLTSLLGDEAATVDHPIRHTG